MHSPYLFAGTDVYRCGKFIRDGRYDPTAIDQQLAVIPVDPHRRAAAPTWRCRSRPSQRSPGAPTAPAAPAPVPEGHHDAVALQAALNALARSSPSTTASAAPPGTR